MHRKQQSESVAKKNILYYMNANGQNEEKVETDIFSGS
jgi:hypothetical protein